MESAENVCREKTRKEYVCVLDIKWACQTLSRRVRHQVGVSDIECVCETLSGRIRHQVDMSDIKWACQRLSGRGRGDKHLL